MALESTQQIYQYDFTAADFLDNLQVKQADNNLFNTFISKDYRKIYLRNNFKLNDKIFGSPIGVCFTYMNEEKEWVKRADAQSSNSKNINTIVGNWMAGKTYAQWRNNINFKGHPYIGEAEDAIIVTMGFFQPEGYVPPPIIEDPIPEEPKDKGDEEEKDPAPVEIAPDPNPNLEFTLSAEPERIKDPKLANLMLRNARFRGPRESYKEQMQTNEFLYDSNILYDVINYIGQINQEFYNALYDINSESSTLQTKRRIEHFEELRTNIEVMASQFQSTMSSNAHINRLEEFLSTAQEVRMNYE